MMSIAVVVYDGKQNKLINFRDKLAIKLQQNKTPDSDYLRLIM